MKVLTDRTAADLVRLLRDRPALPSRRVRLAHGAPAPAPGAAVPARIIGHYRGAYLVRLYANGPNAGWTGTGYLVLPEVNAYAGLDIGTWVLAHPVQVSVEHVAEEEDPS